MGTMTFSSFIKFLKILHISLLSQAPGSERPQIAPKNSREITQGSR